MRGQALRLTSPKCIPESKQAACGGTSACGGSPTRKLSIISIRALVAQHRSSAEFKVLAELHVEVRKRVFGVWHRTYGKSADSMWYQYHPGQSVMPAFNFLEAEEPHMSGTYTSRLRQLMYAGSYWLRRAANAGIPDAMCIIARDYEDQDRFNEAKPLYERAAVLGHYSAPWLPRNIKINKESWERQYRLRMAAESGSTDAMIHLANTLQDASWPGPNEAERWLRKAAKADNDDAMVLLYLDRTTIT